MASERDYPLGVEIFTPDGAYLGRAFADSPLSYTCFDEWIGVLRGPDAGRPWPTGPALLGFRSSETVMQVFLQPTVRASKRGRLHWAATFRGRYDPTLHVSRPPQRSGLGGMLAHLSGSLKRIGRVALGAVLFYSG